MADEKRETTHTEIVIKLDNSVAAAVAKLADQEHKRPFDLCRELILEALEQRGQHKS